jgi:putative transposase
MAAHSLPFVSQLSARQMKSVQNMTHTAVSGWQESLVVRVRELVTGSELSEHRKTVLYRLNARKAWWASEVTCPGLSAWTVSWWRAPQNRPPLIRAGL